MTRLFFWLFLCFLTSCSSTQPVRPVEIETVEPVVITDAEVPKWDSSIQDLEDIQTQYEEFLATQTNEDYPPAAEASAEEPSLEAKETDTEFFQESIQEPVIETTLEPQNPDVEIQKTIPNTDTISQEKPATNPTEISDTTEATEATNITDPVEIQEPKENLNEDVAQETDRKSQEEVSKAKESNKKSSFVSKKIVIFSAIGVFSFLGTACLFRVHAKKKQAPEPEMGVLERFLSEDIKIVEDEKPKKPVSLEELLLTEQEVPQNTENSEKKIKEGHQMSKTYVTREVTTIPVVPASERKGIIGGSQVGSLMGISGCYGSEFDVYRAYMGIEEQPTEAMKEAFYAGNRLEEPIAQWFSHMIGQPVKELDYQYIDPDEPRLVLHPDREFVNEINGKRYALECKTASSFAMRGDKWPEAVPIDGSLIPSWVPTTLEDGRTLTIYDGTSLLPGYYCQCLWYMALAGYDAVFLARLTDNRLFVYLVLPNMSQEQQIYDAVRAWIRKVDAGYRPSPSTLDQARTLFPKEEPKKVYVCDEKFLNYIAKYEGLDLQKKSIEQHMDETKALLAEMMGDAEIAKDTEGYKVCTFKSGKQTRFDTTSFKKDEPELYEQYSKTTETARSLRIAASN